MVNEKLQDKNIGGMTVTEQKTDERHEIDSDYTNKMDSDLFCSLYKLTYCTMKCVQL